MMSLFFLAVHHFSNETNEIGRREEDERDWQEVQDSCFMSPRGIFRGNRHVFSMWNINLNASLIVHFVIVGPPSTCD